MRVVDLDRDMTDVIPTGMSPDSEFLFERMTDVTLDFTCAGHGRCVLDVGSGVGQDSIALVRKGARVVGVEPSARMIAMAEIFRAENISENSSEINVKKNAKSNAKNSAKGAPAPNWIRGWADALPFGAGRFDAAFCKGALDHFDTPEAAIAEMARVTKRDGRVVLAIANFDSLACRVTRAVDEFRQDWLNLGPIRERRGYDSPSDHFTRYELDLMKEQASRYLDIETLQGVSMGWGVPGWAAVVRYLPRSMAWKLMRGLDFLARQWPTLSDVIILVGRPRRDGLEASTTSA